MLYGITGASGVGKSTICGLISDSMDVTFLRTSITESARRHGYNAVGDLNITERTTLQFHLLEDHIEQIIAAPRPIICDRTPIDMAAYMMGEVTMMAHKEMTPEVMSMASSYVERCLEAATTYYDALFHLAPLPFYESTETRPAENPAYQTHIDLIMRGLIGLAAGSRLACAIVNTSDLDERHEFIHNVIMRRMNALEGLRKSHPRIH